MKDFRGKELNIGDKVVVSVKTSTNGYYFAEAIINSFVNRSGYECANVKYTDSMYWKDVFSSTKIAKLND